MDTNIDIVSIFLQGKAGNVLAIIENRAQKYNDLITANNNSINSLESTLSSLESEEVQNAYKKLLSENKIRYDETCAEKEASLNQLNLTLEKLERLFQNSKKDSNINAQAIETKKQINNLESTILALKSKYETNLESLKLKHETFIKDLTEKQEKLKKTKLK